jgi:hypothetical protein
MLFLLPNTDGIQDLLGMELNISVFHLYDWGYGNRPGEPDACLAEHIHIKVR